MCPKYLESLKNSVQARALRGVVLTRTEEMGITNLQELVDSQKHYPGNFLRGE